MKERVPLLLFTVICVLTSNAVAQPAETGSKLNLPASHQEIIAEINKIRQNPRAYARRLRKVRDSMEGRRINYSENLSAPAIEGKRAINSAIRALNRSPRLLPVKFDAGLAEVAEIQLEDLKNDRTLGHTGADGSDFQTRLLRIGRTGPQNAENISYFVREPEVIVMSLIIDDGVRNRVHRRSLLNPVLRLIGIADGDGNFGNYLCVMVMADRFTKNPEGLQAF